MHVNINFLTFYIAIFLNTHTPSKGAVKNNIRIYSKIYWTSMIASKSWMIMISSYSQFQGNRNAKNVTEEEKLNESIFLTP